MKRTLFIRVSIIGLVVLIIIGGLASWRLLSPWPTPGITGTDSLDSSSQSSPSATNVPVVTQPIRAQDITNAPSEFQFSSALPESWQAETVSVTHAINLYDPAAAGAINLDKSQIFIRFFSANDFLTLQTVDILEREKKTVAGHPAVRYVILKKSSVADFSNQPTWRNQKHTVTDVRVSDANPSIFYVIAKRPDLADSVYNQFLEKLQLGEAKTQSSLIEPVAEFKQRITKKKFGTYITPENSPVSPERFSGYHTGVDVEYDDVSSDVSIKAIADGDVVASNTTDGYGGVLAIAHTLDDKKVVAIYGHLKSSSMVKSGKVTSGQQIAVLGQGNTSETDGERKHLHFALVKGSSVNLKGYVGSSSELDSWYNPLDFY